MLKPGLNIVQHTTDLVCKNCDHNYFTNKFRIRNASQLVTQDGQEANILNQILCCDKCGTAIDVKSLNPFAGENNKSKLKKSD